MTKWIRDEFLLFGDKESARQVGMNIIQTASQPNVEEVREIRVWNIVVIWRIRREDRRFASPQLTRISLSGLP